MLISSPAQQTLGLWRTMYTTPLTDWISFFLLFFFSPPKHTQSVLISTERKKKLSCQILYNNLSSFPQKWSPYNTHHREAKDTQVKSTLKSRLSTNQTLSNRLLGAVRCLVLSSNRGEPGCVWRNRKHRFIQREFKLRVKPGVTLFRGRQAGGHYRLESH